MTPQEFTERAWKYVLKRGKVRRVTLRLNKISEDLLLMGPDDLNAQLVRKLELGKSLDEILVVCLQAAEGLAAAHRAGLVHRDFKPDNVIQVGDALKLIDLGGVRHIGDEDSAVAVETAKSMIAARRSAIAAAAH